MIAVEVRRGSHVHQIPHVGRPQIEPSASVSAVSSTPTSAAEDAIRSCFGCRFHRYSTLFTNTTPNASMETHAAGTCTYMIFCRFPMSRSGAENMKAIACAAMKKIMAKMPNGVSQRGRCTIVSAELLISILDDMLEREQRAHEEN